MKPTRLHFGTSTRYAADLPGVVALARRLEAYGFSEAGFPDTQCINPDPFVGMAAVAASGVGLRLATSVSNPVTRHPSVTATALTGVRQLASGGVVFVIAAGDTALLNIGRRPARLDDVRAYVTALHDLQRTGDAQFGRRRIHYEAPPARVPIHLAAHGPRSLELAGEVCDGVWIGTGIRNQEIDDALGHLEAGAVRSGRSVADLEIGCYLRVFVGDPAEAKRILAPSLAAVGHYALTRAPEGKGIPAELRGAFDALGQRYDPVSHATGGAESPNARLVRELGLVDYLAERFALIGSVETVTEGLARLVARGVSSFMVLFRGEDLDRQLREFGEQIIPRVAPHANS